jgi:outer membrane protein TolC
MINTGAATVMVTASFPIFHFGEGSNKIKSAKAEQRIAELEQTDLNEKMQLELAQARNNLDEAFTELELTRKSLEQSDENVKMSKSQYNYGMEPLSDLLEAQSMWQQAYANEVDARCNLFIMNTRYLKALGKLR